MGRITNSLNQDQATSSATAKAMKAVLDGMLERAFGKRSPPEREEVMRHTHLYFQKRFKEELAEAEAIGVQPRKGWVQPSVQCRDKDPVLKLLYGHMEAAFRPQVEAAFAYRLKTMSQNRRKLSAESTLGPLLDEIRIAEGRLGLGRNSES